MRTLAIEDAWTMRGGGGGGGGEGERGRGGEGTLTTQLISEEPSSWTSLLTMSASSTAWILSLVESVR